MDSPTSKSRNKVLILIVGLLIVAVVAAYGVISSGVLEEKIDAEMEITAQIESDNLAYVTVETNLPDETNIIVSLVGAGDSDDTGYNTNYKADDSLQIVDGKAVAGPLSDIRPPEIEIKKEIDIEIEKERELETGQAPARSYGRYNNVFLSDTELDELKAELPDKWEYYIDRLSTHIASKGTKYRSHAATIYKWAQEDEAKKPPKKGIPDYSCKEGESL